MAQGDIFNFFHDLYLLTFEIKLSSSDLFFQLISISILLTISILFIVFLIKTGREMGFRSIRLYSSTLAANSTYILLTFFPEIALVAKDITGIQQGAQVTLLIDLIALMSLFSFVGYFFSILAEKQINNTILSVNISKNFHKLNIFFDPLLITALILSIPIIFSRLITIFFSRLISYILYGILPAMFIVITVYESWPTLSLMIRRMYIKFALKLDEIIYSWEPHRFIDTISGFKFG